MSLGVSDLDTHPSSHPAQGDTDELPWQDLNLGVPGFEACTFPQPSVASGLMNNMAVSTPRIPHLL